jgi:hypothetical protein
MSRRIVSRKRWIGVIAFAAVVALRFVDAQPPRTPGSGTLAELARGFQTPPDDARMMMRWWWFGPSVTKPQLEREMKLMKEGGIGGFEVQPVYPLALDDASNGIKTFPFLSDGYLGALRFTSKQAETLGLRMDLTLGSGWPFGGPTVPVADASARLRVERIKPAAGARRVALPPISENEKLIAVFANAGGAPVELTSIRDGAVSLEAGIATPQEIVFFISSRTGMMVKRPAVGGEGFVLNHYDRGATDRYLASVGDRLMQSFGDSKPPYAIFCDSLEAYVSDWTDDFLPEFQKRRGYDLRPHLPALVLELPESKAIRRDWGRTMTELLDERFMKPMKDWSARNRTLFRIQGYGIPPATISSNAFADLSEGEGHHWKGVRTARWASSASHIFGQPVTSAEVWTWLHTPVFRATPLDMKAEADLHFLQGINQLIGHGWPYTAEGIEYPGWRFYAAGVFNEKNPWWIVMPDVARYMQRASHMLRQGEPRNDIAVYLPNDDAYAAFSTGGNVHLIQILQDRLGPDVLARIIEAGYNFDFVDDDAIARLGSVDKGQLVVGKARFRGIVLPGVESIPPATYRKLEEFQKAGGAVVATRKTPSLAPGFRATEADHAEVRGISDRLFRGSAATARLVVDENKDLATTLGGLFAPDVKISIPSADFGFVHRATGGADIYFVANTSNIPKEFTATFRVARRNVELWDAVSGRTTRIASVANPAGGVDVGIRLEAYGSQFVVFADGPAPKGVASTHPSRVVRPLDWSGGFKVSFRSSAGSNDSVPERVDVAASQSWADDDATRYFSGVATYEKTVTVPVDLLQMGAALRLDFGDARPVAIDPRGRQQAWIDAPIRDAAVIYVNDQRAGSIWAPPYSLDVTPHLKAGANKLRIEVANTAMNFMAGHALPDYKLLNLRYGTRFEAQDMDKVQVLPSGLLRGVRLVPTAKETR